MIDSLRVEWFVEWRDGEGAVHETTVDTGGVARPVADAKALGLGVRRVVGEGVITRHLTVEPAADIVVDYVMASVAGWELRSADALFLNGYNSWTDSVERPPIAGMRGLAGVPRAVVDRWVLDNSGDYRFVEQDVRPGHQHGFGYGYVRYDEAVCLVASLDEDSGFTLIYEDFFADELTLEKEAPRGVLAAGERQELMAFVLAEAEHASADESLATVLDAWLARAGVRPLPAEPLVGYSSWYRHYGDITEAKLLHDLEGVDALLAGRDLGGCVKVFQVDDGYAKVGDWLWPDEARFPEGVAGVAAAARERGLLPGIWLAPFLVETDSRTFAQHKDWLLRDASGELVHAGGNWSGAYALDLSVPEARAYVAESLRTVTEEWGYKLLKLDFLYAACLLPLDAEEGRAGRAGMNRGERMADALELLRSSVGEDVVFDLCGVPLMSAFGRTEYCRIGCDVSLDWDDVPHMRLLHRERVSTKRSLANTRGRAHLDGRVFRNDPDVFFLRKDVQLTDAQRAELLEADATLGGMFLTSDDPGEWGEQQMATFDASLATFVARS